MIKLLILLILLSLGCATTTIKPESPIKVPKYKVGQCVKFDPLKLPDGLKSDGTPILITGISGKYYKAVMYYLDHVPAVHRQEIVVGLTLFTKRFDNDTLPTECSKQLECFKGCKIIDRGCVTLCLETL
jgi:hypothetical protein